MNRSPYQGSQRKVVLSIDLGETSIGSSYSILLPGQLPDIQNVAQHGASPRVNRKIPSVLWYDKEGQATAFGAEALSSDIEAEAVENEWVKVRWFKEYLQPEIPNPKRNVPPLPLNKSGVNVLADLLGHVLECTKTFLDIRHSTGSNGQEPLWKGYEADIHFVFTHPYQYGASERDLMCQAAIIAGFFPDEHSAQLRATFVSAGEASLCCCIERGLQSPEEGQGVLIIDAGGQTVTFSSYLRHGDDFLELGGPQCIFEASASVTNEATLCFKKFVQNEGATLEKELEAMALLTSGFDTLLKPRFNEIKRLYAIRFPNRYPEYRFKGLRIKRPLYEQSGHVVIPETLMKDFFKSAIDGILDVVNREIASSTDKQIITTVFLVGGFGANPYLFKTLNEELTSRDISVRRPEGHLDMLASNGAVAYYLDHVVRIGVPENVAASGPTALARRGLSFAGLALASPSLSGHPISAVEEEKLKGGILPIEIW